MNTLTLVLSALLVLGLASTVQAESAIGPVETGSCIGYWMPNSSGGQDCYGICQDEMAPGDRCAGVHIH